MQTTMGERLRAMREAAGLSQADVAFESRQLPRPMWIDQSKVSRLESGKISEEDAEPFEVCFLASLYGRKTSDASVTAAERMEQVRDLVAGNAWTGALA